MSDSPEAAFREPSLVPPPLMIPEDFRHEIGKQSANNRQMLEKNGGEEKEEMTLSY